VRKHSPPFECHRASVVEKRWLAAPGIRWPVERRMNCPMTTSFGSRKRASKMIGTHAHFVFVLESFVSRPDPSSRQRSAANRGRAALRSCATGAASNAAGSRTTDRALARTCLARPHIPPLPRRVMHGDGLPRAESGDRQTVCGPRNGARVALTAGAACIFKAPCGPVPLNQSQCRSG